MALTDLADWLDEQSRGEILWYAKRLSANDTLANGTHQAGPYIPKIILFRIFSALDRPNEENPEVWFDMYIDSHAVRQKIRAVWYNNKQRGRTRDETRLTNFGGLSSPFLDPEKTGSLVLLSFPVGTVNTIPDCHAWICEHPAEEDVIEGRIGPVEPGKGLLWSPTIPVGINLASPSRGRSTCYLPEQEIPAEWRLHFPGGAEIIRKTIEFRPLHGVKPDARLLKRRECEYEIFQSVEEAIELPVIRRGFSSMREFIDRAQTVLQRRKSRSGKSLELHLREIFIEDGLSEEKEFSWQTESEPGRRPDFIFPSSEAYRDSFFPENRLRMLATKTTCKDRWRQILNEADRIQTKHLLTLQEGVSENQFREMTEAGVRLVVPQGLHHTYPEPVRQRILSLEDFIRDVRFLGLNFRYGGESIAAEEDRG
ncbi:MAG: type II restriction endonuclease [Leptospirales bacterium]